MASLDDLKVNRASDSRGYIKNMLVNLGTLRWIWRMFISSGGRIGGTFMVLAKILGLFFVLRATALLEPLLGALEASDSVRTDEVLDLVLVFFLAFVASMLVERYAWEYLWGGVRRKFDMVLSDMFFDKGIGQYRDTKSFLAASNLQTARARVWGIVEMIAWHGSGVVIYIAMSFVMLLFISSTAGLFAGIMLIVSLMGMLLLNRQILELIEPIEERFRAEDRRRDDIWDLAERVVDSDKADFEVRVLGERAHGVIVDDRTLWLSHARKSIFRYLLTVILFYACLKVVSAQILGGEYESGLIAPVFVWMSGLMYQLGMLAHVERDLSWSLPVVQAMINTLEQESSTPQAECPVAVDADGALAIEVEGLSFTYPGKELGALQGIDLKIPAGQSVAIIGLSGAGKSTLGDMLMRVHDPDEGRVLYNGVDLRELDLGGFRRISGHIKQSPKAFARSIRENVLYGVDASKLDSCSDEMVIEALRAVKLDDEQVFPDGLDQFVGKGGVQMSGGQLQRMMIASVLMRKLRVVVIDEATSSLDVETEFSVQAGIDKMLGTDVTAIVIAHRLSTLRKCDRLIVLRPVQDLAPGESQIEFDGSFEDAAVFSSTYQRFLARS